MSFVHMMDGQTDYWFSKKSNKHTKDICITQMSGIMQCFKMNQEFLLEMGQDGDENWSCPRISMDNTRWE